MFLFFSDRLAAYNYYCKRIVVTWRKEYEAAENKSEWLQKKIKERNPTKAVCGPNLQND